MVLARCVPLEHLIDFHNIGVRFIAMELVTSTIKAKYNPARARFLSGSSFICCVRHFEKEKSSACKATKFGNFGDQGFDGEKKKKGSPLVYMETFAQFSCHARGWHVFDHGLAGTYLQSDLLNSICILFLFSVFVYFSCTCIPFGTAGQY